MAKFNSLLNLRLRAKDSQKPNMTALAEKTSNGNLSSFSGVFRIATLTSKEKETIEEILKTYRDDPERDLEFDLNTLTTLTSEVKAITNQAVMLHGERIKKAQEILKSYKEGAFSAWLIATYGNRQTPYNFLQYYEFVTAMPQILHPKIDEMPRQAVYTLASRSGDIEKKEEIIKNYQGQTKQELLDLIRSFFPLDSNDKRLPNLANQSIHSLKRMKGMFTHALFLPTEKQKSLLAKLLNELQTLVG